MHKLPRDRYACHDLRRQGCVLGGAVEQAGGRVMASAAHHVVIRRPVCLRRSKNVALSVFDFVPAVDRSSPCQDLFAGSKAMPQRLPRVKLSFLRIVSHLSGLAHAL